MSYKSVCDLARALSSMMTLIAQKIFWLAQYAGFSIVASSSSVTVDPEV